MGNASRIAGRIVASPAREGPDENDRDFFKPPAPGEGTAYDGAMRGARPTSPGMTLERFRSIAIDVLRDKKAPFTAADRLGYIKVKGAEFGLNVDDNWLAGLLGEAAEGALAQRVSGPNMAP